MASGGSLTVLTVLTVFSEELFITLIAGRSFCGLGWDLVDRVDRVDRFFHIVHGNL